LKVYLRTEAEKGREKDFQTNSLCRPDVEIGMMN